MGYDPLTTQTFIFNPFSLLPKMERQHSEAIQACSCDYGFDIDTEELTRELPAALPVKAANPSCIEVDPDEFETIYHWFIA